MLDILSELKKKRPFIDWEELTFFHPIGEIRRNFDRDVLQNDLHIEILKDSKGNDIYNVPVFLTISRKNSIDVPNFAGLFSMILYDCDQIRLATRDAGNAYGWECKGLS